mmetsp:Transcript_4573/g.3795  ORF Transcript_4573/g.3795 Transcript_4573/m.3795 type:complete len:107 (+) Transcript_4573:356-676(+)
MAEALSQASTNENSKNIVHEFQETESKAIDLEKLEETTRGLPKLSTIHKKYRVSYERIEEFWGLPDDCQLLILAPKLKLDWKKVAKRMNGKRGYVVTPKYLSLRYK